MGTDIANPQVQGLLPRLAVEREPGQVDDYLCLLHISDILQYIRD